MRAIWIILFTIGWASWQSLWLVMTFYQFDAKVEDGLRVATTLKFSEELSSYNFREAANAKIIIKLRRKETHALNKPLQVLVAVPKEWFGRDSIEISIPPEQAAVEKEVLLTRIPEPGKSAELRLSISFVERPGTADAGKHLINISNSRFPAGVLSLQSPPRLMIQEPISEIVASESRAVFRLDVAPPRSAKIWLNIKEGDAKVNKDFRVVGENLGDENDRFFVMVPQNGKSTFTIEAVHNAAQFNRKPKSIELSIAADTNDDELTAKIAPVKLDIVNSDKPEIHVTIQPNAHLYEGNEKSEVVLKFDGPSDVPVPFELSVKVKGSASITNDDYSLMWTPSANYNGKDSIALRVKAIDDDKPEGQEELVLQFEDTDDYRIIGTREFKIPIEDNDRKLVAHFDSTKLLEGQKAMLSLVFDPPSDTATRVTLRIDSNSPKRLPKLSKNGTIIPLEKDSQGRPIVNLLAPGNYDVELLDDDILQATARVEYQFVPTANDEYKIPVSPLSLELLDDDSEGNVLIVMMATKYLHERVVAKDVQFLKRFGKIRELAKDHTLVGRGIFVVGHSSEQQPLFQLWKSGDETAMTKLSQFLGKNSFVTGGNDSMCLVDIVYDAHKFVSHVRKLSGKGPNDLQVILVWPSEEDPSVLTCRESELPQDLIAGKGKAHFLWLDGDEGGTVKIFLKDRTFAEAFRNNGFLRHFPLDLNTIDELPKNSDMPLVKKINSFLNES